MCSSDLISKIPRKDLPNQHVRRLDTDTNHPGEQINKSKRVDALTRHVATYTAVLAIVSAALFGAWGLLFAALNGVLHFGTDYVTSRWTAGLLAKQDLHKFFVVVGLDQLTHQATLCVTMWFAFYR